MKKSLVFTSIITVVILLTGIINTSCMKKKMEMTNVDVAMSYTPNPATVNTPITFTFLVKDDKGNLTDVSNTTCTTQMGTNASTNMTLTKTTTGTYTGQSTFTAAGTYKLNMGYKHGEDMMSKELSCVVQ